MPPFRHRPFSVLSIVAALITAALTFSAASAFSQINAMFGKTAPAAPVQSYIQPAENLLLIIADIQRHVRDDVYRFPYPQDVNGQNIFRSAIVQLSNYEKLYSGRNTDLVAYAKGEAYERLCAFKEAGLNYEKAQASSDDDIKKAASTAFERCKAFSEVADRDLDRSALRPFEDDLKKQIDDFNGLADKYRDTPYGCLALVERERAQTQLAEFYIMFRFMQPYSTDMVLKQFKKNIQDNSTSKRKYEHHLLLGNFQYELAREYTLLHDPEGPDFDLKSFLGFTNDARAELEIVEKADGYDEKQEAKGLADALEGFVERTKDRAR